MANDVVVVNDNFQLVTLEGAIAEGCQLFSFFFLSFSIYQFLQKVNRIIHFCAEILSASPKDA